MACLSYSKVLREGYLLRRLHPMLAVVRSSEMDISVGGLVKELRDGWILVD